ncbi:sensor histidine kinase [Kiloniella sp. b19]|uniref:sensor histidine kinase n=1 Tax=Kiloniella sp. GXU_MW_B19 TaxID=3141326 RepID=UPI0031DB558C
MSGDFLTGEMGREMTGRQTEKGRRKNASAADGLRKRRSVERTESSGFAVRSLMGKLALIIVVFVAVPVIVYSQFREADDDRQVLMLAALEEQGRLMTESLRPVLKQSQPVALTALPEALERVATPEAGVKVLFRPSGDEGFFFVASEPRLSMEDLQQERQSLEERGVFESMTEGCAFARARALRHQRPDGAEELLTSMSTLQTEEGCWILISTQTAEVFLGSSVGRPYWQSIEVQIAAAIYVALALLTTGIFVSVWRDLTRFRNLARRIRHQQGGDMAAVSFTRNNRVPELEPVAREFDHMIQSLQASSNNLKAAAEDNAHAFKTPLAIMRQALEPLQRSVSEDNPRGRRALQIVTEALERLDSLVATAHRLDQSSADLVVPPRETVALSSLLSRMAEAYAPRFSAQQVSLVAEIEEGQSVLASDDLIETVVENLLDNALEVSPPSTTVSLSLAKRGSSALELSVRDRGPGVPDSELERIFERYVSYRSQTPGSGATGSPHMGIGLWIVRRNIEAIGGEVHAENRKDGGLALVISLPVAT